jgi:hypothetical protein
MPSIQRIAARRVFLQAMSAIGRANTGITNRQNPENEPPVPKTSNPPRNFSDKYAPMKLTVVTRTSRRLLFFIDIHRFPSDRALTAL